MTRPFQSSLRTMLIVTAVIAVIAALLHAMFVPRVSIEEVKRVTKSAVPAGMSMSSVKRWILSRPEMRYQGDIADSSGVIRGVAASVPDSGPRWETPEEIKLWFYFENDKLTRVQIERRHVPFM